jgi:putative NADH-flavin reductase
MKVLIVGATGKIGLQTVDEVLALGHEVTAFGRSVHRITPADNLRVRAGDVLNAGDLETAVFGHDVIILTFGAIPNFQSMFVGTNVCEVGTGNVIAAMRKAHTRRLIALTSVGAGDSAGYGSWGFRNIVQPLLLRHIMKDRTKQEELIKSSDLPEWVIVRPGELNDGPKTERLRHITDFRGKPQAANVARHSVAAFLAKMIETKDFDQLAVLIAEAH